MREARISEVEAIRQVIGEAQAMDFIDVVKAVQKRYHLTVSSSQVEQVLHELVEKKQERSEHEKPRVSPDSRINLNFTANLSDETSPESPDEPNQPAEVHLNHALRFVKSVHGIENAKRALQELEAILQGRD